MSKMFPLFSFVVMAALTIASASSERLFSRRLAKEEGYELTKEQQLVDAFMTVLDHITTRRKDAQTFNGDHLLNMLKKNRDVPFLASLEKKFQPVHDASKSSVHSLASLMNIWEGVVKEAGMSIDDGRVIMTGHELFDGISERLESGSGHGGQSAFGQKGHLKSNGPA